MALKATVFKAAVQLADVDRGVYPDHHLTIARHPSETDERMMVRLLAFALHVPADDARTARSSFAKGMWDPDEPELWQQGPDRAASSTGSRSASPRNAAS